MSRSDPSRSSVCSAGICSKCGQKILWLDPLVDHPVAVDPSPESGWCHQQGLWQERSFYRVHACSVPQLGLFEAHP